MITTVSLLALVLGLAFTAWLGGKTGARLGRSNRLVLWNTAPSFTTPAGYDPNAETHKGGRISRVADAAIALRWSLVTNGAVPGKSIKSNTTATLPIGVVDDTTDTLSSDLTIPLNINLLGGADRTLKVAINSTVADGDFLVTDTTDGRYAMTDPLTASTKVFQIGRAIQSGVAGQVIEFQPSPNFAAH